MNDLHVPSLIVGFIAGTALVTIAVLWAAYAVAKRADARLEEVLLSRDAAEVGQAVEMRKVWDRDKAQAEAQASEPLALLTEEEETNLAALATGIQQGPREARRRVIRDAMERGTEPFGPDHDVREGREGWPNGR